MHTDMPVGVENFKKIREKYYFVDKTDFIRQLIDAHSDVTLITRPRRFGKTLTLSMLDYFFSVDRREESRGLFSGLSIENSGPAYMMHCGAYPVIFMSLKNVSGNTWESTINSLGLALSDLYSEFAYLAQSTSVNDVLKIYFQKVLYEKATQDELAVALLRLTKMLYQYHGKPVILLIDEYDAPIQQAWERGFYDECIGFMRRFLGSALKTNDALDFSVLTGVLRISKESIFSGLNNLDVCSVMTEQYSDVIGFTPDEVAKIASDLQDERLSELKEWYDGYRFGESHLYNPWSVNNFFKYKKTGDYWVNTSGNVILKQILQYLTVQQEQMLYALLRGETIAAVIRESVIYSDIGRDRDALYTMLVTTGYLTVKSKRSVPGGVLCELAIPNREVRDIYQFEILDCLRTSLEMSDLYIMGEDLLAGRIDSFSKTLRLYLEQLVSVYDTANKESFYHGLLLGMMALVVTDYTIESNRESGYGRFDLALFPRDRQKAGVILEFKVADTDAMLQEKAQEALQQIEDKKYDAEFTKRGIATVWKYGIAFCGKKVHVVME